MIPFLLYIARSSLYLALFYAFFLLVMRRTTFFRLNRIILLGGTLACFLLPVLRLRRAGAAFWTVGAPQIIGMTEAPAGGTAAAGGHPVALILTVLYGLGVLTVLALTLRSFAGILRVIRSGTVREEDGVRIVETDRALSSFSWGRTIVISRKDAKENPAILLHERMHIRHHHSLDILLFTACTAVQWFNPLVWITLTELKLLHEYEADDSVLNQGIDATQYQLLLVRKAVGEQRFSLANGFQHSKLKNRIAMMLSTPTAAGHRLAWLLLIPFLAGAVYACNPSREQAEPLPAETEAAAPASGEVPQAALDVPEQLRQKAPESQLPNNADATPFNLVEVKPTFNGGNASEFSRWVNTQLTYPKEAFEAGIQGRVTLQFAIDTDGKLKDAKILRGVNPLLDEEALRVIRMSPDWKPGEMGGKPVKVTYIFPVIFQLK